MNSQQKHRLNWSEWFPIETLFDDPNADDENTIFMVDVGGGLGHDLAAFAARNPGRKIRLINEDLPEVIAQVKEQQQNLDSRVELVEQNFFQPQSVKGARIVSAVLRANNQLFELDFNFVWADVENHSTVLPSQNPA
jgi:hypothetical protein